MSKVVPTPLQRLKETEQALDQVMREVEEWRKRAEEMQRQRDIYKNAWNDLFFKFIAALKERDDLRVQVAMLCKALQYYTTAEIVESWGMQELADNGQVARDALDQTPADAARYVQGLEQALRRYMEGDQLQQVIAGNFESIEEVNENQTRCGCRWGDTRCTTCQAYDALTAKGKAE